MNEREKGSQSTVYLTVHKFFTLVFNFEERQRSSTPFLFKSLEAPWHGCQLKEMIYEEFGTSRYF